MSTLQRILVRGVRLYFGTSTSVSNVRVVGSIDSAVRAILDNFLSRKFLQCDVGLPAHLNERRIGFRGTLVNTRRGVHARHMNHSPAGGAGSRVDQSSRIYISLGDNAGERSIDPLEAFQLFQPAHIGIGGRQVGLRLLVPAGLLVGFLGETESLLRRFSQRSALIRASSN